MRPAFLAPLSLARNNWKYDNPAFRLRIRIQGAKSAEYLPKTIKSYIQIIFFLKINWVADFDLRPVLIGRIRNFRPDPDMTL